jgi:hypothetical protein
MHCAQRTACNDCETALVPAHDAHERGGGRRRDVVDVSILTRDELGHDRAARTRAPAAGREARAPRTGRKWSPPPTRRCSACRRPPCRWRRWRGSEASPCPKPVGQHHAVSPPCAHGPMPRALPVINQFSCRTLIALSAPAVTSCNARTPPHPGHTHELPATANRARMHASGGRAAPSCHQVTMRTSRWTPHACPRRRAARPSSDVDQQRRTRACSMRHQHAWPTISAVVPSYTRPRRAGETATIASSSTHTCY